MLFEQNLAYLIFHSLLILVSFCMIQENVKKSGVIPFEHEVETNYNPGLLLEMYLNTLNPANDRLFQRPTQISKRFNLHDTKEKVWFGLQPIGKGQVGEFYTVLIWKHYLSDFHGVLLSIFMWSKVAWTIVQGHRTLDHVFLDSRVGRRRSILCMTLFLSWGCYLSPWVFLVDIPRIVESS